MPYTACKRIVMTMNAIRIDFALTGVTKMSDTVMNSIEKSFSIERTAFEYDGNPNHRTETR